MARGRLCPHPGRPHRPRPGCVRPEVSGAHAPDEAVFLPGRNALLTIKAAIWCQLHGIGELGVATLRTNPFKDASDSYFDQLACVLSATGSRPIRLVRPFGELDKQEVMEIGRTFPLDLTFSCIAASKGAHCGECNKCVERQAAFRLIGNDPTKYKCAQDGSLVTANKMAQCPVLP